MTMKINFQYNSEVYSFLNKTFTRCAIAFFFFLFIVGYFNSDMKTTILILSVITIIYIGFGIKTLSILKKKKYFIKNGIKCKGIIKDKKCEHDHSSLSNTWENRYTIVHLIVEYKNPYTNEITEFVTESVNGCPFTYLSSLEVTVYALPDGRAYATDFKKIKKLKDAVKYQEEYIESNKKTNL